MPDITRKPGDPDHDGPAWLVSVSAFTQRHNVGYADKTPEDPHVSETATA